MSNRETPRDKILWLDDDIPLMKVSASAGWEIIYHQLYDVHPDKPIYVGNCPGGDYTELFKATLLVLHRAAHDDLIDAGWTPEADMSGSFRIALYRNGERDTPEHEYFTRNPSGLILLCAQLMKQ